MKINTWIRVPFLFRSDYAFRRKQPATVAFHFLRIANASADSSAATSHHGKARIASELRSKQRWVMKDETPFRAPGKLKKKNNNNKRLENE